MWLSVAYRLHMWLRLPARLRLTFYLNAHWLFGRFAHEESHRLYDGEVHPFRGGTQGFIARHLPPDATVLDLGCGNGVLSSWLAGHCAGVVGVDHSPINLGLAKDRSVPSNLEFVQGDARAFLNEDGRQFTVLVLCHILEHLDSPEVFLADIASGFSFVYIEVPDFDGSPHDLLRERLGLELSYLDADHISEFGRAELEILVRSAGLEPVEIERVQGVQRLWCAASN